MSKSADEILRADELADCWPALSGAERAEGFQHLERGEQPAFFQTRRPLGQSQILLGLPVAERQIWLRLLDPDDVADLLQELPRDRRGELLDLLDEATRREVHALLAYGEDKAGGLMSPRFARVRPEMTIDEAIRYLRRQAEDRLETIYYVYALDSDQRIHGVASFRELFASPGSSLVKDIMHREVIAVTEHTDQEAVAALFRKHSFLAVPVLDGAGVMKGIVTIDDIVDVVEEVATEDAQKFGGMEALPTPYLQTGFWTMIKKRAGWLAVLFVGEMLTASAMGHYEDEIAKAVVLALFVPLIISSGGNSGSQASTLVIRAMALGEVKVRDWWRIVRRELRAGVTLGVVLATIGLCRIVLWQALFHTYGDHADLIAATVALSLVGVVTWGTLCGAVLPFILRRAGFDPASASAPFVATLVDVCGLVIYFSVAEAVLSGHML